MKLSPRSFARLAGLLGAAASLAAGCAPDTGGRVVSARFALEGPADAAATFVTDTGWAVTLDEACIALGPVYVFELGGVLADARPAGRRGFWRAAYDALVPPAHAHPGDGTFFGGEVKAEWLVQVAVDPTRPGVQAGGPMRGTAGPVRSLTVHLEPPRAGYAAAAPCLRGHHAYVVGTATKGDVVVPFEGGLDVPNEGTMRRVDGIPLVGELDDGVTVVVRPDVRRWFSGADFATLAAPAGGGRRTLDAASQPHAAWSLGARSFGAFQASLVPAGATAAAAPLSVPASPLEVP